MLLAIDLGNTTLTLGVFDQEKLQYHWRLNSDRNRTEDEYGLQLIGLLNTYKIQPSAISGIIIASVVPPLTEWIVLACKDYLKTNPLLVNSDLRFNIKVLYDNPSDVGADRLADAVAYRLNMEDQHV